MSEPLVLVMLLVIIVLPAVLIARTGRRLGQDARRRQQLGAWAELRGWRLLSPAEEPVGRWQVWPFTAVERETTDAIAGVHRGREVTSLRLEAVDGPRRGTFHVLTVALEQPQRPRTLLRGAEAADGDAVDGGGAAGGDDAAGGDAVAGDGAEPAGPGPVAPLAAAAREYPGLSARLEGAVLVGWLPGAPLLTELDAYLDALTAIADAIDPP